MDPTDVTSTRAMVIDRLQQDKSRLVEPNVQRLWTDVPGYADSEDPDFYDSALSYNAQHHALMFDHLRVGTLPTREELGFMRAAMTDRVSRLRIDACLHAYHLSHDFHLERMLELATDPEVRDGVLDLMQPLLRYINCTSGYAAELYVEFKRLDVGPSEAASRDLLEALLSSRSPTRGTHLQTARRAGLAPDRPCMVVVVSPTDAAMTVGELRSITPTIAVSMTTRITPLVAVRDGSIVAVVPTDQIDMSHAVTALSITQADLDARGIRLSFGVSTVHDSWDTLSEAHAEALHAADMLGDTGGVLALATLRAFEYATTVRDPLIERLIDPAIRRFVESDLETGGTLVDTLLDYFAADLNVKTLSERIHIHPNTARYRLQRIAEKTNRDVRNVSDVVDIVIAVRTLRATDSSSK